MVATVAGGALLSASIQVLFDRMASRDVLTFLQGQKLSAELLWKLKIKLLAVQAVLNDAEVKQITDRHVKEWVDELKHAVYDAEDLLDEITTEALRCKMESDSQTTATQVWNIISAWLNPFGGGIKSRVKGITDKLELLAQEKDVLGLKEGVGENLSKRWPTTSLVDESGVCGREGDIKEIIECLLCHNESGNKISVIALVGMGGIGKTTLTQLVYNDRRVEERFDLKAWICVSNEFDLVRITKTILKEINSGASEKYSDDNDLNLLQRKLKERLSRKKFLLVLDDVWNENYNDWDMLQTPFAVGLNGSKIIVTTRSDKVASVMRSVHTRHLEQLSFEDCWKLFAKHAFKNGDSRLHPKLEEIGKEIVKKCKGLPLAAKTLGGALYSELRVEEWENLLNSETWDFRNDEILPALRLSYSFLPSHLKRCFAYCSIFPKDYEFEKENLILLWMAEGFLEQSEGKKTMEKVGDGYFDDLLSRSFFQKSSSHKSYFVMHDLINDLAQLASGKFCVQLKDGKMNEIPEKLRHLSYFMSDQYDHFERFETLTNVDGLRTFLPLSLHYLPRLHLSDKVSKNMWPIIRIYMPETRLSDRVPNDLLPKIQYLRVLSLRCYRIYDLPDTIGNLKHLRYLDLSYTYIQRLSDSVCSLYNLQTLIVSFCHYRLKLPIMMSKLSRLRHLDIRHSGVTKMPSQMGQLKSLQKLTNYKVGKKSGTRVAELRELSHIGGLLVIEELQNVVDGKDASEANLVGKQYLDDLRLEWNHGSGVEHNGADIVLNNLQPHSNLQRLTIQGYGGLRFPDWLGSPAILINMVSLRLWSCKNVSAFPPLGQLPSLKHLYISRAKEVERVGAEFYGTNSSSTKPSFVSLKALSFQYMPKWKEWLCSGGQGGEFPRLKELYIRSCSKLTGDLPDHLPLLTKLEIEGCEQLVAPLPRVPAILELNMRYSRGVFLESPTSDFMRLESLITSNISQWKELPPVLQMLCIESECEDLELFPKEGLLPSTLTSLEISGLPNLKSLDSKGLQLLTTLQKLEISDCPKLLSLPEEWLPTSLSFLTIRNCPLLEDRCKFGTGEDWHHIAHIPHISINHHCRRLR